MMQYNICIMCGFFLREVLILAATLPQDFLRSVQTVLHQVSKLLNWSIQLLQQIENNRTFWSFFLKLRLQNEILQEITTLSAGPPTYTQLGSQNIPSSQPNNFSHSSPPSSTGQGMWPQHWQGGAAEATQNPQGQPPPPPNGQQNEEFSDVLRMLDPPGQEFNDLSGMFNTFQD